MSTELPANDFPFLNRLLAEIKSLREAKRPRRTGAPKQESQPAALKHECAGRTSSLSRHTRQAKTATGMANEPARGQR